MNYCEDKTDVVRANITAEMNAMDTVRCVSCGKQLVKTVPLRVPSKGRLVMPKTSGKKVVVQSASFIHHSIVLESLVRKFKSAGSIM